MLTKRARDGFIDDLRTTREKILKNKDTPKRRSKPPSILTSSGNTSTKKLKGAHSGPRYVAVNEFMENGLVHMHIIVFGTSWVAKREQISADWNRCGQGQIVKALATHRNPKTGIWEWDGSRPEDADPGESPRDYLKKIPQQSHSQPQRVRVVLGLE